MAVPSSGQLRLRADINQEINGNDTDTNVSLGTLSDDAGFDAPDTMSEFYDYSACDVITPANVEINIISSTASSVWVRLRYTDCVDSACQPTSGGIYLGTSSTYTNNTKHTLWTGSAGDWGCYSTKDFTISGTSSSTTYYARMWVNTDQGESVQPWNSTTTSPPPSVPVQHGSLFTSGDWAGANYCPNYNFIGGLGVSYLNSSTSMVIKFYGDSNFTNCSASYPNCLSTYNTTASSSWQSTGNQMFRTCCTDNSSCGNSRTGYAKYTASGYADVTYSHTRACPAC